MLDWLINLLYQNPLIFLLIVLSIISYISIFIYLLYVVFRKGGKQIKSFKFPSVKIPKRIKIKGEEIDNVEDLYKSVITYFKSNKILDENASEGYIARKKILDKINDSKKKEILKDIFSLYEAKIYGNKRIKNEKDIVRSLYNNFTSAF